MIAGDGVYSYKIADGSIVLEDLNANKTRMLVDGDKILDVSTWTCRIRGSHS